MDSELYFNTQVFERDKKYCECEACNGVGSFIVNDSADSSDPQWIKEDCERCEGSGVLELEE